jgi:hypothetical protein
VRLTGERLLRHFQDAFAIPFRIHGRLVAKAASTCLVLRGEDAKGR